MGIRIEVNLLQVLVIAQALEAYAAANPGKHIDCFDQDMSKSLAEMFADLPAQVQSAGPGLTVMPIIHRLENHSDIGQILPPVELMLLRCAVVNGRGMTHSFCDAYPADEEALREMRAYVKSVPVDNG